MGNTKVGLLGIGLDTYWNQFEGLKERLEGYQQKINQMITSFNTDVVDVGLIDSYDSSAEAASRFAKEEVEVLFLYISTYALSSTILPLINRLKLPIIVLNIQPTASIDYDYINALGDRGKMTGEWLANCQACSVPEVACVLNKFGAKYEIVSGYLDEQSVKEEIGQWLTAVNTKVALRNNRMGVLGHYYCGMMDVYSDMTLLSKVFGTHFDLLEMCELQSLRASVSDDEVRLKGEEFATTFDISQECEQYELDRAAKTSVALDRLVEGHKLTSMAYYYEGTNGNEYENIVTSVIAGNTLLTGNDIPIAGECEIKNAHAMKILSLMGAGGSFSEFYGIDFKDDIVLLGHDGPAHHIISDSKVKLVPLPIYHGKPGKGLSIQMNVAKGAVTVLSVVETNDGIKLLVAEGESVEGVTLQIGNTNSRYKFPINVKRFIEEWSKVGPSHHCAIGVGHRADEIRKLGFLLNIDVISLC